MIRESSIGELEKIVGKENLLRLKEALSAMRMTAPPTGLNQKDRREKDGGHQGHRRGYCDNGMPGMHDKSDRQCPAQQHASKGTPSFGVGGIT
jgi:hypothetical protein